jgi:hypothetical protein
MIDVYPGGLIECIAYLTGLRYSIHISSVGPVACCSMGSPTCEFWAMFSNNSATEFFVFAIHQRKNGAALMCLSES